MIKFFINIEENLGLNSLENVYKINKPSPSSVVIEKTTK